MGGRGGKEEEEEEEQQQQQQEQQEQQQEEEQQQQQEEDEEDEEEQQPQQQQQDGGAGVCTCFLLPSSKSSALLSSPIFAPASLQARSPRQHHAHAHARLQRPTAAAQRTCGKAQGIVRAGLRLLLLSRLHLCVSSRQRRQAGLMGAAPVLGRGFGFAAAGKRREVLNCCSTAGSRPLGAQHC